MDPTRRTFTKLMGTLGASSILWDQAVADVEAQGAIGDDTLQALLEAQGGPGIFADPERLAELKSALARSATRLAAIRAFRVSADVAPVVTFRRD